MFVVARVPTVRLKVCQTLLGPLISGDEETPFTFHQSAAGAGQRKLPERFSILFILHIHHLNERENFFFLVLQTTLLFLCSGVDGCSGLPEALPLPGKVGFSSLPVAVPSFEGSSWHKQGPLFYSALHSAPVTQCFVTDLSRYAMATTLAKKLGDKRCIVQAVIVACACRYSIMIVLFSFNNAEHIYTCSEFSMLSDICCCIFE